MAAREQGVGWGILDSVLSMESGGIGIKGPPPPPLPQTQPLSVTYKHPGKNYKRKNGFSSQSSKVCLPFPGVGLFLRCSIVLRAQTNTYQMRELLVHTKALLGSCTLKLF